MGITMIDMIYNLRVGDIHAAEFSDEFNKLCIPFENSLSEEQIYWHKNIGREKKKDTAMETKNSAENSNNKKVIIALLCVSEHQSRKSNQGVSDWRQKQDKQFMTQALGDD